MLRTHVWQLHLQDRRKHASEANMHSVATDAGAPRRQVLRPLPGRARPAGRLEGASAVRGGARSGDDLVVSNGDRVAEALGLGVGRSNLPGGRGRARLPQEERPGQGCNQRAHWPGSKRVGHRRSTGTARFSRRGACWDTNLLALSSGGARGQQAAGRTAGSVTGSGACFFSAGCTCRAAASKLRGYAALHLSRGRQREACMPSSCTPAGAQLAAWAAGYLQRWRAGRNRRVQLLRGAVLGERAPLVSVCALLPACKATRGAPGRPRAAAALRRRRQARRRRCAGPRRRCAEPGRRRPGRPPHCMRQAAGSRLCRPRPWRERHAQRSQCTAWRGWHLRVPARLRTACTCRRVCAQELTSHTDNAHGTSNLIKGSWARRAVSMPVGRVPCSHDARGRTQSDGHSRHAWAGLARPQGQGLGRRTAMAHTGWGM